MSSRPVFLRYFWFMLLFLGVSSFILPRRYGLPYPQTLGPKFTPGVRREPLEAISANRPDIILVGDSVLYLGVDADVFSKHMGMETYSLGVPGSGSAVWYLLLKNVILDSSHRPKMVVILFRDTMLTVPDYRTTGRYFGLVDDYAGRYEPLLAQLAYIDQMNPLEKLAEQYLPLYSARWEIRERLDRRLRYTAPSLFLDCPLECVEDATNSVFGRERVDAVALNQAVEDAAVTLYSPEAFDFTEQVEGSFLPAMIRLAQANDIELVLVRTRTLNYPTQAVEPPALRTYIHELSQYLSGQPRTNFIDYAQDVRLKDAYFLDSLHFNAEGKEAFTQILADELKLLVK